jgi:hypothetical protein
VNACCFNRAPAANRATDFSHFASCAVNASATTNAASTSALVIPDFGAIVSQLARNALTNRVISAATSLCLFACRLPSRTRTCLDRRFRVTSIRATERSSSRVSRAASMALASPPSGSGAACAASFKLSSRLNSKPLYVDASGPRCASSAGSERSTMSPARRGSRFVGTSSAGVSAVIRAAIRATAASEGDCGTTSPGAAAGLAVAGLVVVVVMRGLS